MAVLFAVVVVVLAYLLHIWVKRTLTYWSDRGVKGPKPIPLAGNFGSLLTVKESLDTLLWDVYKKYPEEPVVGLYLGYQPILFVKDLDIIKHILIKDFGIFQDRGVKKYHDDSFDDNLFNAERELWKVLRNTLTPIFSSGKLRSMMPLIQKCTDDYLNYVDTLVEEKKEHEIRSLASKYTLEIIGSCAFGVDMETFTEAHNPFYETANMIFNPSLFRRTIRSLDFFIPNFALNMKKYFNVHIDDPSLKIFFMKLADELVQEREGKPKIRNDLMDLLIELKEQGKLEKKDGDQTMALEMGTELVAAQVSMFVAGGFDTSSATMSFLMFELTQNEKIQERLYEEISSVSEKHNGKVTYESIKEMSYLEMCFDEALRKYPVGAALVRQCSENYKIPDTPYMIEKDMKVLISVLGLHRDPKYYKDPEVYDPERFSNENKHKIPRFAYMPFGDGPRSCIGKRFAKVESMLGMASFLQRFRVEKSSKTPEKLTFDLRTVTLTAKEGIWLNIIRR